MACGLRSCSSCALVHRFNSVSCTGSQTLFYRVFSELAAFVVCHQWLFRNICLVLAPLGLSWDPLLQHTNSPGVAHRLIVAFRLHNGQASVVVASGPSSCCAWLSFPEACRILVPDQGSSSWTPALQSGFPTTWPPRKSPGLVSLFSLSQFWKQWFSCDFNALMDLRRVIDFKCFHVFPMKLGMAFKFFKIFIYLFRLPQILVMTHRIFIVSGRIFFACSAWTLCGYGTWAQ